MPNATNPPDPLDRLTRLAPAVDEGAATSAFRSLRHKRTRRRRAVAGGLVAVVAAIAIGVGVGAAGREPVAEQAVFTGRPPAGSGLGPVSVEQDGFRLTLDAPRQAAVGTRVELVASLTNTTDEPLRAGTVGGCDDQVTAGIEAEGADPGIGPRYVPKGEEPTPDPDDQWRGLLPGTVGTTVAWDGRPETLASSLAGQHADDTWSGSEPHGCKAMFTPPAEIAPGETVERRIAVDLRWGADAPTDEYEAVALGGAVVDANGMAVDGAWPPRNLRVSIPIKITDDPVRASSREAALGALESTPTLPEWIVHTADINAVPGFVQQWSASTSWWNGGWETWIAPKAGNGHQVDPLRIRWDPEREQVVDVRTVFWGGTPSDDPAQPDPLPEPVDDVRYHLD